MPNQGATSRWETLEKEIAAQADSSTTQEQEPCSAQAFDETFWRYWVNGLQWDSDNKSIPSCQVVGFSQPTKPIH